MGSLTQGDTVTWMADDKQGTPRDEVDSGGNLVNHSVSSAFGQDVYDSSPSVAHWAGFGGGHISTATGLVNDGYRWLDPATGHWLSNDPIDFGSGETNLARYAGNDPANAIDPSGLWRQYSGSVSGETYDIHEYGSLGRRQYDYSTTFRLKLQNLPGGDPTKIHLNPPSWFPAYFVRVPGGMIVTDYAGHKEFIAKPIFGGSTHTGQQPTQPPSILQPNGMQKLLQWQEQQRGIYFEYYNMGDGRYYGGGYRIGWPWEKGPFFDPNDWPWFQPGLRRGF